MKKVSSNDPCSEPSDRTAVDYALLELATEDERADRRDALRLRAEREKHSDALASLRAKTEEYAKHNVAFERSLRKKGWY